MCSNETVQGIQFKKFPKLSSSLVVDMSSDFLSRPIDDWANVGCIYVAAQKNFGFAGLTVVVLRKDFLLERPVKPFCSLTLDLRIQMAQESIYNTPPTFLIHYTNIVLK
jgi:phosphoserine aminotransferase